jgi:hypothetical protein
VTRRWYWRVSDAGGRQLAPSARAEKHERLIGQGNSHGGGAPVPGLVVGGEDGHSVGVEGEVATLVQLGVLLPHVRAVLGDAGPDHHHLTGEIDVAPA